MDTYADRWSIENREYNRLWKEVRERFCQQKGILPLELDVVRLAAWLQPVADDFGAIVADFVAGKRDYSYDAAFYQTLAEEYIAKGWLQRIDEAGRVALVNDLRRTIQTGPFERLPECGEVDVALAGALLLQEEDQALKRFRDSYVGALEMGQPPDFGPAYNRERQIVEEYTFPSHEIALCFVSDSLSYYRGRDFQCVSLSESVSIGPWRRAWWDYYPTGFRVRVTAEKASSALDMTIPPTLIGEATEDSPEASCLPGETIRTILNPLNQRVTIQQHGLAVPQWQVLRTFSSGPLPLESALAQVIDWCHDDPLGIPTDAEAQLGLQSCLDSKWICVLDEEALHAINQLLTIQPAIGPLEELAYASSPAIGLTSPGAALLQRVQHALYGPALDFMAWSMPCFPVSHWQASRYHVHRLSSIMELYYTSPQSAATYADETRAAPFGGSVSAPVPTGSWCTHWWQRYPEGFRVDVEREGYF
jgi:hypothetical protein